jgi:hypothetical protein
MITNTAAEAAASRRHTHTSFILLSHGYQKSVQITVQAKGSLSAALLASPPQRKQDATLVSPEKKDAHITMIS